MNDTTTMDLDQVRAVTRSVDDVVRRLRTLNRATAAEAKKLKDNQKYSPSYITTEMKRLRDDAALKATVEQANVQAEIAAATDALKSMTAPSILNRAVFKDDTARIAALLTIANTPSTKLLARLAEALRTGQWAMAAACLDAAELRAEQNPDNGDLRSLARQMEMTVQQFDNIPGKRVAEELAVVLRVKAASLDSVLYAIRHGEPDSGPRDEMIYQMRRDGKTNDEINAAVVELRAQEARA